MTINNNKKRGQKIKIKKQKIKKRGIRYEEFKSKMIVKSRLKIELKIKYITLEYKIKQCQNLSNSIISNNIISNNIITNSIISNNTITNNL